MVAGLATITPGAGFLGPLSAIIVGLLAGMLCYIAVVWKMRDEAWRDVMHVEVTYDTTNLLRLLFDPDHSLEERILNEQFL